MTITKLLDYNPDLLNLLRDDSLLFVQMYNAAYHHVRERFALYPKFFKCTFTAGADLNKPVGVSTGGYLQFKEITEVLGQEGLNEQPHDTIDSNVSINVISPNSGLSYGQDVFFSHNYVFVDSDDEVSLPLVGHLYPPAGYIAGPTTDPIGMPVVSIPIPFVTLEMPFSSGMNPHMPETMFGSYSIPDILVFPMTAKMYALLSLETDNVSQSNAYDALCNHYINMRNAGRIEAIPKSMSQVTSVTPYGLF